MARLLWPLAGLGLACPSLAAQQPALPEFCEAAAVGGGWAGVYYAYRLATSGVKVCLFEASSRIGGRTYSHRFLVNGENYTLDVGAYRFTPDMHLPGDIILKVLKLPTACYEPDCRPADKDFLPNFSFPYKAPLRRIVDAEGMPAGYITAIDGMVDAIKAHGGKVFTDARLTDVAPGIPTQVEVNLTFGTRKVGTRRVLLNLPRPAVLGLRSLRLLTPKRVRAIQECEKSDVKVFPSGHSLTKAYAFYDEAWWLTRLNRSTGMWPSNAFVPLKTAQGIPIGIHFNDGPVRCKSSGKDCRGFLEVLYAITNSSFFENLSSDPDHPLGVLSAKDDTEGKLKRLHAAIMEATDELWRNASATRPSEAPSLLATGVWRKRGVGMREPSKVYFDPTEDPLERACGVPGLTEEEYRRSVLMPLKADTILVANNDWVAAPVQKVYGDWAEESLLQVERALRLLRFRKPTWLDQKYYDQKVAAFTGLPEEVQLVI